MQTVPKVLSMNPSTALRRLGAVANGWEPSPTAAKADVTEGLYCGNFRFGTLSMRNAELMLDLSPSLSTTIFHTARTIVVVINH